MKITRALLVKWLATYWWLLFLCQNTSGQIIEIRRLQQELLHPSDSLHYIDDLNRIGLLMHMKDVDSCFYYGVTARAMSVRLNYAEGEANAINNIAAALYLKGLYSQALTLFATLSV